MANLEIIHQEISGLEVLDFMQEAIGIEPGSIGPSFRPLPGDSQERRFLNYLRESGRLGTFRDVDLYGKCGSKYAAFSIKSGAEPYKAQEMLEYGQLLRPGHEIYEIRMLDPEFGPAWSGYRVGRYNR